MDESVMAKPALNVQFDRKIRSNLLSKAVLTGWNPENEITNMKRITDSKGNKYNCVGTLEALWRTDGNHSTVRDDFVITDTDLPTNIGVLMAETDGNLHNITRKAVRSVLPIGQLKKDKS